jgi:putative MATE family efflux protein
MSTSTLTEKLPRPAELSAEGLRNKVLTLAWPALVEMMLISLVSMADMIMVGRIGPAAIASVGLTNQPMFFAMAVFMALNVGTTAIVARSIGAKDLKGATDAARQSFMITVLMGLAVSSLAYFSAPYVLRFMNAGPDVLEVGTIYFRIVGLGLFFSTLAMSFGAVLRGSGDTKTPMKINMVANVINVTGNYLLIFGHFGFPRLGVAGAALATTFSRVVAMAIFTFVLFSGKRIIAFKLSDRWRFDWTIIKRISKIGSNAALEQFVLRGGQVVFARVVASLGTATFAAHQIGLNVLSLSFMPGQAFGMSATTLVGQSLGAKDPKLAERCGYEARRYGRYVATGMSLVFFFFGAQIASLYSNDPEVIRQAALSLRIIALVQPLQSTQFILAGGLRGAGDTRWPLYSTFLGIWVGRVLLATLFIQVFGWGLWGAWVAMALDQVGRSLFISYRFKSGHWKYIRV